MASFHCVQPFTRFVELGRVALINYGPDEGRLCTIIDVVDQNRALVEGPYAITGVHRQVINLRRLDLTDHKVKIGLNARAKSLKKAWAAAGVAEKWAASAWAKKRASRASKAALTDLDRFKNMLQRKTVRIRLCVCMVGVASGAVLLRPACRQLQVAVWAASDRVQPCAVCHPRLGPQRAKKVNTAFNKLKKSA